MNGLTLAQLRSIDAVVSEGSLQAAALRLGRTHPTLHTAIINVERQIGFPLFDRTGYRMVLTPAGEAFLARARRVLTEMADLQVYAAQLAAGDSLALPPEAVDYIDRLRALGLPEAMVDAERDAWILVAAQLPERMALYMEMKGRQLDDPATVELYRQLAQVIVWEADDPRIEAVGDLLVAQLEQAPDSEWEDDTLPDDLAALLDAVFLDSVPAARRMLERLEQRGWTGWTKIRRLEH